MNTGYPKREVERRKYAHSEHYTPDTAGQPELHIVQRQEEEDFEVWLNTGIGDDDGLLIGIGRTRQEAVTSAHAVIEWLEGVLQGPPPVLKFPRPPASS